MDPGFRGQPVTVQCAISQNGHDVSVRCGTDAEMLGTIRRRSVTFQTASVPSVTFVAAVDGSSTVFRGTWHLNHPDVVRNGRFEATKHMIGALRLGWSPDRVGTYRLHVRERMVTAGSNEVLIIPDQLVPASTAGPRFAWLDPAERLGVRLWYVRVLP